MRLTSSVLLALCLVASTTVSTATLDALAVDTATESQHIRALRGQEAAAEAATTTDDKTKNAAGRAIHRTYDAVTGLYCERVGACHVCPATEKDEVYCRETGHRQELSCFKSETIDANAPDAAKELRFQACEPIEKAHPVLKVVTFEIVMAGILAGSFVLLKRERRKHMSAFDLRKDPRQRSTLLGGDKNAD